MRYLSSALAVAILATASLPGAALAKAPRSKLVAKQWRDGNTLRRQLLKNPRYRPHLLAIGRLATKKKPGVALVREIQKLTASRPRKELSRLAWSIVAQICIRRGVPLCRQWDRAPLAPQPEVAEVMVMLQEIKQQIERNRAEKKAAHKDIERLMQQMADGLARIMARLDTVTKNDESLTP